jgi:hypothetical protein
MRPELTFPHVVDGSHIGYGRMGVCLAKELRSRGYLVYDSIGGTPVNAAGTVIERAELEGNLRLRFDGHRSEGITNVVCWAAPPSHARGWWKGQVPTCLTMWEATELPPAYRESFFEFDTIMVPSVQNLELFSRYHDNVRYVPLGIDPESWFYQERRAPSTRFTFLCAGTGERKGADLAVAAFKAAFPPGSWGMTQPVPYLVLKQPRDEGLFGERIEHVLGYISAEAERDIYADAHCYLGPSRGEGFGLQPLQAIAQGIPTILTNAHGHAAFAHLGMGLSSSMAPARGFVLYGEAGNWWEPDLDELVDAMRYVYENYAECTLRAQRNAAAVLSEGFTWDMTAHRFVNAIGLDRLCEPYAGPNEWHEPEAKLYPVVLARDTTVDIGGTRYAFERGVERWVPADVKRIFFTAGQLDPVCLEGEGAELGLHPEQVGELDGYLERAAYCPTCHQKYGSGTKREAP